MRTWVRASRTLPCGGCNALILGPKQERPGAVLLEVGACKLIRCQACAKRMFDEDPPAVLPSDVPVPVPSLPLETIRRPDFVTPGALARASHFADFKARQTGERDPGQEG